MKKLIQKSLIIALFFLTITRIFAQKATDDFSGKWKTPEGRTITISKTGTTFIGKAEDNKTIILDNFKFSKNKWFAVISKPSENKSADCDLFLEGEKLKIIAKKGMMSRTIICIKIK